MQGTPLVVAETAKPAKFPEAIKRAIGVDVPMPDEWKHLTELPERVTEVGVDVEEVKQFITATVG